MGIPVKRVVLFGTGAMSCLFAARLAEASNIAMIGTWTEGIDAVRSRGILLEGLQGATTIRVNSHYIGEPAEPADLAIILVKAWQTGSIARHLSRYLRSDGIAISLQNGLGNLELLGERASPGSTAMGAALLGPGHVQPGGEGLTQMIAPDWVVDLFRESGLDARRCNADEAESLLWGKLCVSCGINALTALLRIPNGGLLERPDASALMVRATEECAAIAKLKGIGLPFPNPALYVREVAVRTATNRSSMLQDILRGAPTECDAINGAVVSEGKRLGAVTPVNEILRMLVRAAGGQNRSDFQKCEQLTALQN
jgi:2-dehydropantoate 2-reductase